MTGHRLNVICARCHNYSFSDSIAPQFDTLNVEERAKFSGWIYEQNELGEPAYIDTSNFDWIRARPIPPVEVRASRLLSLAVARQKRLGARFKTDSLDLLAATYSLDEPELRQIFRYLEQQGYIRFEMVGPPGQVTFLGFAKGEELAQRASASSQGFVAMWFTPDLREAYDSGFASGISRAGYVPFRIDLSEHNRKIDDEIIAQIKRSRFVVADFTGHRGGVYFEAGFALGREMPVVWTCRKDHLDALHFDVRQFNCIDWDTSGELAKRLQNRIEAVIGRGPKAQLASS